MTAQIQVLEPTPARSTHPDLVLGYEASRASGSTVHDLVGGSVAISLAAAAPRSGSLDLFYRDKAPAWAAYNLLNERVTFAFDPDYLAAETGPEFMLFAVVGQGASIRLDEATRRRWIVTVEFQELSS